MLMGKVRYRCDKDSTIIVIPAKCIETFCIGSAFPLNKSSGSVSTSIKEETIRLVETTGAVEATRRGVVGTYTRDEDNIEVFLPIRVCETVFKTESYEGELRIEVVDDAVLVTPV
ncbi:MAG: hypothetical protein ABSB81_09325 [Halobacteriota archaeon]|jgi:hypothetical protein